MADVRIRLAEVADAEAIRTIYNLEVTTATSTFDLVTRSLEDQVAWLEARSGAFSAIVAVDADDTVVGFASLSPYKERAAYRTTVEDSVYVDRDRNGQGIGQLLLSHVVDVARASGFHAVMARIEASGDGQPGPPRPVRLRARRHRARGRPQVRPLARRRRDAARALRLRFGPDPGRRGDHDPDEDVWAGKDSNLRRRCRQVYSLLPLATRAPTLVAGRDGTAPLPCRDMPSFDVVSEVDRQEVRNAVDQAQREIGTRFDFKGTNSSIEQAELALTLRSVSEDRLTALRQVLEEKLVKRKVSLKGLEYGNVEEATQGTVRQTATITVGISSDKAREINKLIKEQAPKGVNSQTQGDSVRVSGKKRDDLQAVMQVLREADLGIPIQFDNRRD